MNRWFMRSCGSLLTSIAAVAIYAMHASVLPTPTLASECCQNCESQEMSCSSYCDSMSHPNDATNCWEDCEARVMQYCWNRCSYCTSGGGGCYLAICTVYHTDYCYWNGPYYTCVTLQTHQQDCHSGGPVPCS